MEPSIEGGEALEDDMTSALMESGLDKAEEIVKTLENSAEAFRRNPPNYNSCLSEARVALQTLATGIADSRQRSRPRPFNRNKWGEVIAYLRVSGLITNEEEEGLAGVFKFVSPGAHRPVGSDEEEMARLGRALVVSMCYFLVKAFIQRS